MKNYVQMKNKNNNILQIVCDYKETFFDCE